MAKQDPFETTRQELKTFVRNATNSFIQNTTIEGVKANSSLGHSGITVTFAAEGTDITLYADIREVSRDVIITDDEGNEYVSTEVVVSVNYPSHGSRSASETVAVLEFCLKVAKLGQSIVEHFKGRELLSLYRSAEEKAKKAQQAAYEAVKDRCASWAKGMRVDQTKTFKKPSDFKDGEYEFTFKEKAYRVRVVLDAVFVTRTH